MVLSETNGNKIVTVASEKKQNESNKVDKKSEKQMTKIIVRRLPPSMTLEEFLNQVSPIPDYDYIYAVKGDLSLGENAFSRVYINFVNVEDIYMFKEKFDNYVFVDSKGHEYAAVVEYAAFQKVPKRRKQRPDVKVGTIESDPVYLEFLESLKEQPNQEEKPEYSYVINAESKNEETTPLLDYLRSRKLERTRIRNEKRDERRKKELDRKKMREEEKRKRLDEKKLKNSVLRDKEKEAKKEKEEIAMKTEASTSNVDDSKDEQNYVEPKKVEEKPQKSRNKYEDRKFDDRKTNKSSRLAYSKHEDRKGTGKSHGEFRDNYHSKKFEEKKPEVTPRKVKKYSEKREERKNLEAKKLAEEKKVAEETKVVENEAQPGKIEAPKSTKSKGRNNDPRVQRRIRNKDRPTMAIYKPGMLRKKSSDNEDKEENSSNDAKE